MTERDFEGRVALVTGGTMGIGRATADLLGERGAMVTMIGHGPDVDDARAQAARVGREDRCLVLDADVSDATSIADAVSQTVDRFGGLDVVVCSAGIQTYGTVDNLDEEVWDRTLDVNLKGMFLTAKAAIPHLRARGKGAIVNVCSVQATANQLTVPAYAASKAGIRALTRAMALDHAPDQIRVVSVSPGAVDTPMLRTAASDFAVEGNVDGVIDEWGRSQPLGRVALASEVAEFIAFLASDRAAFITGSDHVIDGGLLAMLAGVELPK